MAKNCSAQQKVTDILYGYDIRKVRGEYLIASSFLSQAKAYATDLQNYAYNKYKLGPESPLLHIGEAQKSWNKGYKVLSFNPTNFTKLDKLIGDKATQEDFERSTMRNYNEIEAQVKKDREANEKFLAEQAEKEGYANAYQEALDALTRETDEYLKSLEDDPGNINNSDNTFNRDDVSFSRRSEEKVEATPFNKLSLEKQRSTEHAIREIADKMSIKIGVPYQIVNSPKKMYAGTIDKRGVAIINLAYAGLDTPIHEIIGHALIKAVKQDSKPKEFGVWLQASHPELFTSIDENLYKEDVADAYHNAVGEGFFLYADEYQEYIDNETNNSNKLYTNLTKELQTGKGAEVLADVKTRYTDKNSGTERLRYDIRTIPGEKKIWNAFSTPKDTYDVMDMFDPFSVPRNFDTIEEANQYINDKVKVIPYTEEEHIEEAIVELLGQLTAGKLDAKKDANLIQMLKDFLKQLTTELRNLIKSKEIKVEDLRADMTIEDLANILAFSDAKIILPGKRIEYVTPDGEKHSTYQMASRHLGELAKRAPEQREAPKEVRGFIEDINLVPKTFKYSSLESHNVSYTIYYKSEEDGWVSKLDRTDSIVKSRLSDKAVLEMYNSEVSPRFIGSYTPGISRFLYRNKEYEQGRVVIDKWKKEQNITYNPEEVYSRGQGFYSAIGAYKVLELDTLLQNLLDHIEDNKQVGSEFTISAFTRSTKTKDYNLEGDSSVRFKIFPESQHIKWAAYRDVYSGSVWESSNESGSDKKSEITGVSYTKTPALNSFKFITNNLVDAIEQSPNNYNELGISLTPNNFRLEYDENIPPHIKELVNNVNSILDEKYGKLIEPNSKQKEIYTVSKTITSKTGAFTQELKTFDSKEEADAFVDTFPKPDMTSSETTFYKIESKLINSNIVKTFEVLSNRNSPFNYDQDKVSLGVFNSLEEAENFIKEVELEEDVYGNTEKLNIKTSEGVPPTEASRKARTAQDYLSDENSGLSSVSDKDLNQKAIMNLKIVALKSLIKKQPRSLIVSKIIDPRNDKPYDYYEDDDFDLPFQKPKDNPMLPQGGTDDGDDFSYSQRVNYNLKSVDILSSDKAKQIFEKGKKANWDLNKILTELQIPKEQKQLILETGLTNRDEIAVELASKYSQVVEINTAKEKAKDYDMIDTTGEGDFEPVEFIPDTDLEEQYDEEGNIIGMKEVLSEKGKQQIKEKENERKPTNYYVDLTVPGGTNYTENEIATPSITPSIRGHAQFATDNGIGWFRSDDKILDKRANNDPEFAELNRKWREGEMSTNELNNWIKNNFNDGTKTRRILEVQSDLFQQGRKSDTLTGDIEVQNINSQEYDLFQTEDYNFTHNDDVYESRVEMVYYEEENQTEPVEKYYKNGERINRKDFFKGKQDYTESLKDNSKNKFLQLLNKNNNWVTFFVKSIIQDSAKKGYEKILFPSGNTASKVEGHTTLEEFKKQKEDRLKQLDEAESIVIKKEDKSDPYDKPFKVVRNGVVQTTYKTRYEAEKEAYNLNSYIITERIQLKQELERVEGPQGFGALKPIYNFYENTVGNILNKTYGKENVKQITDEHGNTWNEVTIQEDRDLEDISFSRRRESEEEANKRVLNVSGNVRTADPKNAYLELKKYRDNLLEKSKATLHALEVEIRKTTDLDRKQELLRSYESLKDYTFGSTSRGIEGIEAQQIALIESLDEYNALVESRAESEKDLYFHTQAGELDGIAIEEANIAAINLQIHENKYEDMTSILRTFVHVDLNRAKALVKTGKLEDLKDALGIINYYKALDPNNTQRINPFFTTEELQSDKLSEKTKADLKEFSDFAKVIEDDVYNGAKEAILKYINSLDYYTRVNAGKDYNSEDIFKTISGLPDISWLDSYMGNISDNPYSKEQSVLLNAIHKQLEDRIAGEQADIKAIEDSLDELQDPTQAELIRLGHTVENSPNNVTSKYLTDKAANFFRKQKASFNYFKQVSKNGVIKNRLVQQASSQYEGYIKEAKRIYKDRVESIREGKSKFTYDKVLFDYHNKLRESSHVIKPHLIAELATDDKYQELLSSNIIYSKDVESEMEEYRNMLISEIGEIAYNELVEKQRTLLDDYLVTASNNRKSAIEDYRELLEDESLEFEDIEDVSIIDKLENWELDNNPFNLGFLFEENKKFKITRQEESRPNHFSNYGSRNENIDYNAIIPRKNKVKVLNHSDDTIPNAFKKISIEQTDKDSGYLDPKFREIQDNEILYKYYQTLMDASDYYEQSLTPSDRSAWEKGTIPLDKNVQIKRFTEETKPTIDAILSFLSKPFRDMMSNYGESISTTQELAMDFSDVDMTTNQTVKKINASSLNVANRAIYKEIMVLRATELYLHLKDKGFSIKEKNLTRDKTILLSNTPQKMLKEALMLTGNYTNSVLRDMDSRTVISQFKDVFNVEEKIIKGKDQSSVNILGLLEDLHIQNNLLQSEEDLGLIMRKNMAEAGVINARKKAQVFIEFMADFYDNIGNRSTTNKGKDVGLFKNDGNVKITGDRVNGKRQLASFMDKILYLGGDSVNKSRTIAGSEIDQKAGDSFFNRVVLGKKDKLGLIDQLLKDPNLTEKQRTRLLGLKVSETKYVDMSKSLGKPAQGMTRFFFLAAKVVTHINNLVQGQKAIIQMDGTGTYWEPGKIFKAQQVMQQATVRVLTNGKVIPTPAGDKARFIIDRMQIIEDASTLEAKALHRNQTASYLKGLVEPYSRVKNVEYVNQGSVVLAMLMSEKIKDNTGKQSDVWSALDKTGKLKDEFRYDSQGRERTDLIDTWEKFKTQKYFDFRSKLKEARNKTAGNYDFETSSIANNNEFGKILLGLKRWMYELFSVFYGNERMSYAAGKVIKGRTNSFTPEELLIQRATSGLMGSGAISGVLGALPLYAFDLWRHSAMDKNSRPERTWGEFSGRMGLTVKIAMKTAVGLPLNLATNLTGIKPLIDLSNDGLLGKFSSQDKLSAIGLSPSDIGNVNAMGRSMGMQMISASVMLMMYAMLQSSFDDDDTEEERKEIKRRKALNVYEDLDGIIFTRKDMSTFAYNLASSGYRDGLTYMMNPVEMYESLQSIAMLEWYTNFDKFTKLADRRITGLDSDQIPTGPYAGQSKTARALEKFAPVFGRDLKSSSKKPYQVPLVFELATQDTDKKAETIIKNLRQTHKATIKKEVEGFSEAQIEQLYEARDWKFTPSTDEKPRELDNVIEAYSKKVMDNLVPKPTKPDVDFKELKKDVKAVLNGDMSPESYRNKYILED